MVCQVVLQQCCDCDVDQDQYVVYCWCVGFDEVGLWVVFVYGLFDFYLCQFVDYLWFVYEFDFQCGDGGYYCMECEVCE